MNRRALGLTLMAALAALALSCASPEESGPAAETEVAGYTHGLLVALARFEVTDQGKVLPNPQPARMEILVKKGETWSLEAIDDPESNVFHKAMVYDPGNGPGILTLGGQAAILKLWRPSEDGLQAETLWQKDFGGRFSRMREAEIGDIYGNGTPSVAVATHDQGVVAVVSPDGEGGWKVDQLDFEKNTVVHEIELGDLNGDGVLEIYATPSEPNKLDGTPQTGKVVRYVPAAGEGRTVVADLGDRHAKEILVSDVDGDDRQELYVSVEAVGKTGTVEIRRYENGTDPAAGAVIATLKDKLCRFLTAGDIDGDGKLEMAVAAMKSGLWLVRPGADPNQEWEKTLIDGNSSGFEHAAIMADLNGDRIDELYVASDNQGEIRAYTWEDGAFRKEVLYSRPVPKSVFTWNLMPVPVELLQ